MARQYLSFYLVLWALFPLLLPFYVFGNGLPQPAHMSVVLLMVLVFFQRGFWTSIAHAQALKTLAWFVWYVCVVNLVWFMILRDSEILIHPLFYIFNALVFAMLLALHSYYRDHFVTVTMAAVGTSAVLQAVLVMWMPMSALRQTGFFNTSNQLGYFSIICASLFFVGTLRVRVPAWQQAIVLASCYYLAMVSLSRGALFGMVLLTLVVLAGRPRLLLPLAASVVLWVLVLHRSDGLIDLVMGRVTSATDDSFAMRGYDRIYHHPEHLFLGAGEGGYRRFISLISSHEIHSSIGTLVFSYGIVGTALFALFLMNVYRGLGIRGVLYSLPVAMYGMGHQGLRFTILWVFLAFMCCIRVTDPIGAPAAPVRRRVPPFSVGDEPELVR